LRVPILPQKVGGERIGKVLAEGGGEVRFGKKKKEGEDPEG